MVTKSEVLKVLKKVKDPEIGINIVDMGFIYEIDIEEDKIKIKMTLTSPGCPMHSMFTQEVEEVIKKEFDLKPEIEIVFDPPWTPERLSKEAKEKLGFK
jgi:metal-sulfur cluster biosynthetic enzyme